MITGAQIRAARGALGWSGADLAAASSLSLRTITKIEAVDSIADTRVSTILQIKECLEAAGIEFITSQDGRPGVLFDPNKLAKR